ncbi:mechanosensitive ion channel family protein [Shewanella gelidii]|uniref:mechanosensitive ion channel family protein n=1 Tax=Shewanella gelidii TaxID=1642821 RepID=UPI0016637B64|nr:mechanosensitive ion channel family protein [Shewanella gelidii]MCL1098934.1 mechanosensitive ion channel family protein [Shewanella gelidii]
MDQELRSQVGEWLTSMGINGQATDGLSTSMALLGCMLLAIGSYYFVKRGVVSAMNLVIQRSKVTWDDVFMRHKVLEKFAMLVPALVLNLLIPMALTMFPLAAMLADRVLSVWVVILLINGVYVCLDAANEIADVNLVSRRLPIKSFVQLFKLFLFFVGIIVSISVLADESPVYFLSGLGVATGLVMLVFRDTILGFVAGIQLAANRMVSPGDWIEMPKYGADGDVAEVTLTTVKVRNWDNTITMIPAYALVSDAFKNWRGMSESGGRRIKRSVALDIQSIRFLTEEDIQRLSHINLLKAYLSEKQDELNAVNCQLPAGELVTNGRTLTNIGTFRAYLLAYLKQHPKVHQDMTLLVRQLAPSAEGVAIEVYLFINDTRWAIYEDIQADIFDHIFAILSEFELNVFQRPAGTDMRQLVAKT